MKNPIPLFLMATAVILAVWLLPFGPLVAQNSEQVDQMLPLARSIGEQQKQIAANQLQIEKTVGVLMEEIRLAKIYASRSGKGGTKK